MRYLYSPSTLRAPPVLWPARTDARAVFEVLLATAVLLEKRRKKAVVTLHDDRRTVPSEQVQPLRRVCHYGSSDVDVADSLAHHQYQPASWDTINRGRGRRGRRTSVSGGSPCQRVASYTSTRPH